MIVDVEIDNLEKIIKTSFRMSNNIEKLDLFSISKSLNMEFLKKSLKNDPPLEEYDTTIRTGKIGTMQNGSTKAGKRDWSSFFSRVLQKEQVDIAIQNNHSENDEGLLISEIESIKFSQGTERL